MQDVQSMILNKSFHVNELGKTVIVIRPVTKGYPLGGVNRHYADRDGRGS